MKNKTEDYLIKTADLAIAELVCDKMQLAKAYNYYHGIMDADQFAHLESNFGIGNPTSIEFIPLIRKHIDSLIGEYLTNDIKPRVSCKDTKTLKNIQREKQLTTSNLIATTIRSKLSNSIYSLLKGDTKNELEDAVLKQELKDIEDSVDRSFISNFEIASQHVINYLVQARNVDLKNKLKILIADLLTAGETYYKVEATSGGTNINIRILNPLNTFVDRNPKEIYMNKGYRSVIREWLSLTEIQIKYGEFVSKEDLDSLEGSAPHYSSNNMMLVNASNLRTGALYNDGILAGIGATPTNSTTSNGNLNLYPVYEVEWIDVERVGKELIANRYSVVKINDSIYILHGKDEEVIRSIDTPNECALTVNGLFFTDRTGLPYSLVLATASLQDKFNILHFYRDNAIAQSGTIGSWVDVSHIPTFLGATMAERLLKWDAYKKAGKALFDSSQEGDMLNTTFNNYDDTIKVTTIQAIDLAIQRVEETASSITGVFRERLGGIQQKDAVQNVEVGMQQSYIITKQYYQAMETLLREILIDSLDLSKKVFKKGLTGSYILGDNQRHIFTALPEHFTISDHDVHIGNTVEILKEQEILKQMSMELTKGGQFDPEILVIIMTAKSLSEMRDLTYKTLARKKVENNQLQQLNQALLEAQKAQEQAQTELDQVAKKLQTFDTQKIQLDKTKIDNDSELGWYKAKSDKEHKDKMSEMERRRIELEGAQLLDNNANNDEIKNN